MMSAIKTLTDKNRNLINIIWFQVSWWGVVLLATQDQTVIDFGVALTGVMLSLHFCIISLYPKRDLILMFGVGAVGYALDSALSIGRVIRFYSQPESMAPFWILCLWLLFPLTLPYSMKWLEKNKIICFIFGAAGGPVTYYAGESFKLLRFMEPKWLSFLILAVVWGSLILLLFFVLKKIDNLYEISKRSQNAT